MEADGVYKSHYALQWKVVRLNPSKLLPFYVTEVKLIWLFLKKAALAKSYHQEVTGTGMPAEPCILHIKIK